MCINVVTVVVAVIAIALAVVVVFVVALPVVGVPLEAFHLFLEAAVGLDGLFRLFALGHEQLVEFAAVEPDALAAGAYIDVHAFPRDLLHLGIVVRAQEKRQESLLKNYQRSRWGVLVVTQVSLTSCG